MDKLLGKWHRHGIEMNITRDKIQTTVLDPLSDVRRTLTHDYLFEADRLQLYSPSVRDIKNAFKGELRIIMITPFEMTVESDGGITHWNKEGV